MFKKQQSQLNKATEVSKANKENTQQPTINIPSPREATSVASPAAAAPPPSTQDMVPDGLDAVELGQQVSNLELEVATLSASLAGHERVMREQARENQRLQIVEREAKRDSFKAEETK